MKNELKYMLHSYKIVNENTNMYSLKILGEKYFKKYLFSLTTKGEDDKQNNRELQNILLQIYKVLENFVDEKKAVKIVDDVISYFIPSKVMPITISGLTVLQFKGLSDENKLSKEFGIKLAEEVMLFYI